MIAIIPAKGTSTRVPRKNLLPLNNMPLYMHSVEYAKKEGVLPIVSTDLEEIIN